MASKIHPCSVPRASSQDTCKDSIHDATVHETAARPCCGTTLGIHRFAQPFCRRSHWRTKIPSHFRVPGMDSTTLLFLDVLGLHKVVVENSGRAVQTRARRSQSFICSR